MIVAIERHELMRCLSVAMANQQVASEFHERFGTGHVTHTMGPAVDVAYGVVEDRFAGLMETVLASNKEVFHVQVGDSLISILASGDFLDVTE